MPAETETIVLEHLRHIRGRLDGIANDMRDVKFRLTNLEESNALGFAGTHRRMDRLDERVERIERRLELVDEER